ncbi:MAG: glycosyltransferase family 4 protein, partial [Actinomycetota bacterium]|nr:glycosyltransferase family 4 protein [Actinomycetota bacterium]
GSDVTVAAVADRGRAALADLAVHHLVQPEGDRLRADVAVRVGLGMVRTGATGVADQRRLAARLPQGSRSRRFKAWYTLLPFLGRRWDAIHVPAELGASPYLPLFGLIGPAVVSVERPLPDPGSLREVDEGQALRAILSAAAKVECSTPVLGEQAVRLAADPTTVEVVPPFVDTSFFTRRPERRPGDLLRLVCTPSFHWRAGHDELLVAVANLVDAGTPVHLHVVADGADQQRLLFTVHDLGLSSSVSVHRDLRREELRGLLQDADVFVLASTEDRLWPEVLEARAVGLPAVVCDVASNREAHGTNLILVPPHDPAALARALVTFSRAVPA